MVGRTDDTIVNRKPRINLLAGKSSGGTPIMGEIGERQLVAVQTVDIARLTTHPVPIVPGTFVAVTGKGPKGDSNGSGKTTFLSAVSLLHCDSQWRLDVDGHHAAGLLFRPGAAGLDSAAGGAERGYVIGVFAHGPTGTKDPLTVWVKVSRKAPYILMRYVSGFHVLHGETDQERSDQAEEQWQRLPGGTETGSRLMATTLFGTAPRCLAYLDTTLRPSAPSLLSQQLTQMSPELIGEALIALTGRDQLLDEEVSVRRKHAGQNAVVTSRIEDDQRDRLIEDAQMQELRRRDLARQALAKADRYWDSYLAHGFLEKRKLHQIRSEELSSVQERLRQTAAALTAKKNEHRNWSADTDLSARLSRAKYKRDKIEQHRALVSEAIGRLKGQRDTELRRRAELQIKAEGDDGQAAEVHAASVRDAEAKLVERKADLATAKERHQKALDHLEATRRGRAGQVGEALAALEGKTPAVGLLDAINLNEDVRPVWEPRLWRYRDAVVVAPADEQQALDALTSIPGATVVLADGALHEPGTHRAPAGITCSVPLTSFLESTEKRLEFHDAPDHVRDAVVGESVLGGFPHAFTGRESRIALAQAAATATENQVNERSRDVEGATSSLRRKGRLLEAATAAADLRKTQETIKSLETELGNEQKRESDASVEWTKADEEYGAVKSAFDNRAAHLERLQNEVTQLRNDKGKLEREERTAIGAVDRVQIKLWEDIWHRTAAAAEELVAIESRQTGTRSSSWWLSQALLCLNEASTHASSGRTDLSTVDRSDADPSDADSPDAMLFATRTRPLRDLLDETSEADQVLADRIARNREKRQREIDEAKGELNKMESDLEKQQQMVESSIDGALRKISSRFNQLDERSGWGARLDIVIGRPTKPEDPWTWHVTPRWRRSPAGGYISYKEVANSAQVKIFAIQLVLAALLADDSVPGRLLVLDELGNSLGDANRKDVLTALHSVAAEQNVTILGTCQDSVIYDAAGVCGEILWFRHASATDPYNKATRAWGFDADHNRVDLVAAWLQEGRNV